MTNGARTGTFAELLRRHRASAGLSQHELTRRSGLSERALRDLERGRRLPRTQSVRLLADALSLTGEERGVFLAAPRDHAVSSATVTPASDELVGRHSELTVLLDLATGDRHRLISVTGPAGVGKSRIVAELAATLTRRTDVLVRTVDLSAVHEPELVGELIAGALGCGPSRLDPVDRIAAHLGDRRVVLVVDRFEQLVDDAAELAALVRRCPGLTIVVTTQRRLRLRDERVVPLSPLSPSAAATLFLRRAETANPGFVPDEHAIAAIRSICARVDNLPLAIELAAARLRLMRPAELAERLGQGLRVLAGGARDLPARHRSLREAITSSLEVVGPDARAAFRWFGAFAGGGRLRDFEAVANLLGNEHLLEALTELVDINLLRVTAEDGVSRYTLPDTAAELAGEQLAADGDRHRIARAVATHFLALVRDTYTGAASSVGHRDAANVRAAVLWTTTHEPATFDATTAAALGRFYETTGRLVEGQDILSRIAASGLPAGWVRAGQLAALRGDLDTAAELADSGFRAAAADDHPTRVSALSLLAQTAVEQGDPRTGRTHLRTALREARLSGDDTMLGRVLNNLASVSMEDGRPGEAERQMRAALDAKRRAGAGPVEVGRTLFNLADIGLDTGNHDMVVERAREAVPLLLSGGFPRLAAAAEAAAALATLYRGDPTAAMTAVSRAARLLASDDSEDRRTEALVRLRCAIVYQAAGDTAAAWQALRDALPVALEHTSRDRDAAADVLQSFARHLVSADAEMATTLVGAGERLRRRRIPATVREIRDGITADTRERLGEPRFTAVFTAGRALADADLVTLVAEYSPR